MSALQVTWFLLIGGLLTVYAILDGFDLGVGFWHLFTKKDNERRNLLKSIGPVWDGNEVWLLTGGGAIFAAFPPVYASVFSGLYMAVMFASQWVFSIFLSIPATVSHMLAAIVVAFSMAPAHGRSQEFASRLFVNVEKMDVRTH